MTQNHITNLPRVEIAIVAEVCTIAGITNKVDQVLMKGRGKMELV